ncbi:hypothetical protein ILUMI_22232 [Ignelater luminosus]|uniref:Retrovirus-related Pol polyprotein from transposon TNT 1-94 n=1 Tax=Ignelater luminosus TaxID=2038154 RepID=A0A8K0CAI6_IGNLU|nr:hypothetical protein ILUMI_22232 [Ignelater luminosus]
MEIKWLGNVEKYVGINVEEDSDGVYWINQTSYIDNILKKFSLENSRTARIPLDPGYYKRNSNLLPNNRLYRQAIGSLLYIAVNTRPDIAASVSILSRRVSNPRAHDWTEVKRILRYLKGTKHLQLKMGDLKKLNETQLVGYADADWGGDQEDRKSNSAYMFFYHGGLISWSSRKQTCVSLLSTEAENILLVEACQEALRLKGLLEDFNECENLKIVVNEDNQSCFKLLSCERITTRSKHIGTKYNFCKDLNNNNVAMFQYYSTDSMVADALTKPLAGRKFGRHVTSMGLCDVIIEKGIVAGWQ